MALTMKILSRVQMTITVEELNKKLTYFTGQYPEFEVFYDGDLKAVVGLPRKKGGRDG